jgi:formylglycine-generating enzyme required for sulfatase activity
MAGGEKTGDRVALVIGNGAYTHALPLRNPANDGRAIGEKLGELGFSVTTGIDLGRDPLENALFDFEASIEEAEVALLYYAGHGLQVEGENYLLAVDANIEMKFHLKRRAFSLNEILSVMSARDRTSLVFLDACRNNPFPRSLSRVLRRGDDDSRGLAIAPKVAGTFIAFATAPNEIAQDGKGKNSPFTEALLKHIGVPNISILDMMTDVINEVMRMTGEEQQPWIQTNLRSKFYFRPPAAPADLRDQEGRAKATRAAAEWEMIKDTDDIVQLESFVQQFAGTHHAGLAEDRIAEVEEAARAKAAAEAEARAKAEAERKKVEARAKALREEIARASDRETLFALFAEDPAAVNARLRDAGFINVPSRKDGKPVSFWLKSGESFQDLDAGPEMVVVPAGRFKMGAQTKHNVVIPNPFAVGKYPITFNEWNAAFAAGGVAHRPEDRDWGRERRPVIHVSWDDAQACIKWLSKATGQHYRLLSEAEWEYACRAGSETAYCFGDNPDELKNYAWFAANSPTKKHREGETHPVGEKKPNAFGLYDMHGNVFEWCEDCWNKTYDNAPKDGSAWTSGQCDLRVQRGGAWNGGKEELRSDYRYNNERTSRRGNVGFRVARTL